jgi:hypothetical protein
MTVTAANGGGAACVFAHWTFYASRKNRIWEGRAKIIDNKIIIYGKNLLGNIWMEYRDNY